MLQKNIIKCELKNKKKNKQKQNKTKKKGKKIVVEQNQI